jgi:hypothetical protein
MYELVIAFMVFNLVFTVVLVKWMMSRYEKRVGFKKL